MFICSKCPSSYTSKINLEKHRRVCEDNVKDKCKGCDFTGTVRTLSDHKMRVHVKKELFCDQCDSKFNDIANKLINY